MSQAQATSRTGPLGRPAAVLAGSAVLLLLAVGLRLIVGPDGLDFTSDSLLLELRARRVLLGCVVGGSLALAGVLLQSLLRNPLAAPGLLGLSAGGQLAVGILAWVSYSTGIRASQFEPLAALAGALLTLGVLYTLGRKKRGIEPVTLILMGVVLSVLCGAGTTAVRSLMPPDPARPDGRWLFGTLYEEVEPWIGFAALGGMLVVLLWSVLRAREMDTASLPEDEARSAGVRLGRLRIFQFLASGLLTAGAVALAGPIGFVGLVAPHAVRIAAGPAHRPLLIGATLAGAALVVGSDVLVRLIDAGSGRLPIGVITSLVGGPVLLLLLRRRTGW